MKKYVPFTSVSVDPEIQRMRDILVNGGYVDDDGSLYNDREAAAMNQDSGVKTKAVPKTVVSIDLEIESLRDEDGDISIDEDGNIVSKPAVPKCCVGGARTVRQLIEEMRYETCLWDKKYIRKMREFHFEQKFEGWGRRAIDMTRLSDNKILVCWTKEDKSEKKVVINEHEWNCFISYLFNEIEIDLWSPSGNYKTNKIYLPDGRPYREVPTLDGGEWSVSVVGEERNHEYKGTNRVPTRWDRFIAYINKIEDAIDLAEPGDNILV